MQADQHARGAGERAGKHEGQQRDRSGGNPQKARDVAVFGNRPQRTSHRGALDDERKQNDEDQRRP